MFCKYQIGPILKERSLCEIIDPQGGRIFMQILQIGMDVYCNIINDYLEIYPLIEC